MEEKRDQRRRILILACIITSLYGCASPAAPSQTAEPAATTARPVSPAPATVQNTPRTPTASRVPATNTSDNSTVAPTTTAHAAASATTAENTELIVTFTADQENADPGDSITLSWEVNEEVERVTLCRMMPTGQYGTCWDVDREGSQEVTIPVEWRNSITYTLGVSAGDESQIATVSLLLSCPDTWFMANPPDACPAFPPQASSGSAQYFENGMMIWRSDQRMIYVLYYDGASPAYQVISDQWVEGMAESDPSLTPPPGLFQPVRGFGRAWRGEAGYSGIRERIGWAIGGEFAFDTVFQCDSAPRYNNCYLLGPDGVILIKPNNSGWENFEG